MKKRKAPLGKQAEATRKAHSAELFKSLLLTKHTVVTPKPKKDTRSVANRKAISESY